MNKEEVLNIIKEYVKNKCIKEYSGHDYYHIKRVYNTSMLINKQEKADEFIIGIIALMHDIYDHKFFKGNVENQIVETLKELKVNEYFTKEELNNIAYSCSNLSFSSNIKEKKLLSKEGQIVQDADRLDAIGAIGIARVFAYGGKKNKLIYDEKVYNENMDEYKENGSKTGISHFYDKLLKVKDSMNTKKGKELAEERTEYMKNYLDEFYAEWYGQK